MAAFVPHYFSQRLLSPLIGRYIYKEDLCFIFSLYDDERLIKFDRKEKQAIIGRAIKNYRKDVPINRFQRISIFAATSLLPASIIYYFFSYGSSMAWFSSSALIVASILAYRETPDILPYLDKELEVK